MILFLCKLWPYLAGGLIGWFLAGWLARRLRNSEPSIEKIVTKEVIKPVDNPEHIALISQLKAENSKIPNLKSKLSLFESSKPRVEIKEVEKIVEVDSPKLLARIRELEAENSQLEGLKTKRKHGEENTIEVEKIVNVDNPKLLAEIKALKNELKAVKKETSRGSTTLGIQSLLSSSIGNTPRFNKKKELNVGKSDQKRFVSKSSDKHGIDYDAAKAAGFKPKRNNNGYDDFTIVEGIGPKINSLIHDAGIHTYDVLGKMLVDDVQKILNNAGPRYKLAKPGTWPAQAGMAADGRWEALKNWQNKLDGGKE